MTMKSSPNQFIGIYQKFLTPIKIVPVSVKTCSSVKLGYSFDMVNSFSNTETHSKSAFSFPSINYNRRTENMKENSQF